MLIKREDRPVVCALLAVAAAFFLNFSVSPVFPYEPQAEQKTVTSPKNGSDKKMGSLWDFVRNLPPDDYIAFFTFCTVVIFGFQLWAMLRANTHFRVTERGYVRMSHVSKMRTGLQWNTEPDSGEFNVMVEVKNCGRTPARVTAVWLTRRVVRKGQEFPVDFSYADDDLSYDSGEGYSFVMPSDAIYVPQEGNIREAGRRAADDEDATLIVFGYVDYIDQFGVRHHAGYGRQYIPNIAGNNLGFPNVKAKLNYDEIRAPDIGWDWPQS